jgi:CCR4-NOT transcription complex subunit 2
MGSGGDMTWLRQSPSRGLEQITRPVQQILSSPVDKWGLQALLYEIKMGKGDRALLMFGEDLSQLGVDLEQPK